MFSDQHLKLKFKTSLQPVSP